MTTPHMRDNKEAVPCNKKNTTEFFMKNIKP